MSKKRLPSWLYDALPYLGVVVGIAVLASPVIADCVETWRSDKAISEVTTAVERIPQDTKAELLAQAHAYNTSLATRTTNTEVWPYERQLSWEVSQVMCWVEIPRIDVRLGVYHGTGENKLMAGAGHLEGTSLPVGGSSTHCVLMAHTGMPTARMFDDIRDLEPGDLFVLWTLDEPYAYRVTGNKVVEPDDMSSLSIEQGKDLCTLVTCTPYGVNSKRLLVYGERCAYEETEEATLPVYVSPRVMPLVAGLVITGAALTFTSWRVVRYQRRRSQGEGVTK